MKKFPLLGLIILSIIGFIILCVALKLSTIKSKPIPIYFEYRILDGDTILMEIYSPMNELYNHYYDDMTWEEIPTSEYTIDGKTYYPITIQTPIDWKSVEIN
jgi:hypothetical protein